MQHAWKTSMTRGNGEVGENSEGNSIVCMFHLGSTDASRKEEKVEEGWKIDDRLLELFLVRVSRSSPRKSSRILHWSVATDCSFPKSTHSSERSPFLSAYRDDLVEDIGQRHVQIIVDGRDGFLPLSQFSIVQMFFVFSQGNVQIVRTARFQCFMQIEIPDVQ